MAFQTLVLEVTPESEEAIFSKQEAREEGTTQQSPEAFAACLRRWPWRSAAVAAVMLCLTVAPLALAASARHGGGKAPLGRLPRAGGDALVELQTTASPEYTSVMNAPLSTCSKPGMAMTGFTRDGRCVDFGDDDQGSHHICIKMEADFCTVTGQPNWCVSEMDCMGQSGKCPIGNWCVCQWAFATYLQMAGGCDKIVDLECDATNMAAFKAYEESTEPSHKVALECIKQKCGLA